MTGTGAQGSVLTSSGKYWTKLNISVLYLQILRLIEVVLTYCDSNCNSVYKYWHIVTCTGTLGSSTDLL